VHRSTPGNALILLVNYNSYVIPFFKPLVVFFSQYHDTVCIIVSLWVRVIPHLKHNQTSISTNMYNACRQLVMSSPSQTSLFVVMWSCGLLTYHEYLVILFICFEEYSYYFNAVIFSNNVIFLTEGISFAFFNMASTTQKLLCRFF